MMLHVKFDDSVSMHKDGLPLISNQSIQPLFKSNQFFFELSKLTSLNEGRKRDPHQKYIPVRVAL